MSNPAFDSKDKLGTVEGKIRAIAESMGVNYLFCNWAQANVEFDKIDCPTIVYVLPPSGDLYFSWQEVKDYPEAQIAFLCSTEFDFESDENDALIEQMKRLCIRFVKVLNESGYFAQIEGKLPYQVLYDHLDENVTGIVITPTLEEEEGVSVCEDPEREVQEHTDE